MAVYKRTDRNTWVARLTGPDGRLISKNFAKRTDAVRWHADMLAKRERGEFVDPQAGKITLAEFYADWSPRQVWEKGTERAMSLAMRTCTFAEVPLGRVRRSHTEAWVKSMTVDLAPGTVKTRFTNVRNVLRAAVRDRVIAVDPSEGVVLPRQRRREVAMEIPTAEQLRSVLDAATEDFMPFLALCAFAGLRLGEAAALQVGDIDFMRRTVKVRRQVQRAGGKQVEIRKPKYGSERDVYVPDALLSILSTHISRKGLAGQGPKAWLFTGQGRDEPPHQNTVGTAARRTFKRAGVTGYTLHSLRHYFASTLLHAGADVVTVQRAMGHASAATTLRVYAHWIATAEDRTRQAASDAMAEVFARSPHPVRTHLDQPQP